MLNLLTVKNFALLKDMELELFPGFTAITGETGAGKSLLAGAIAFLVGGKPNFAMVRDGSRFAMVEGEFALGSAEPILLRREITADGRTRVFYQDSPIRLKELLEIAQPLVDITSQRAFSHLLEPAYHLDFLDRWGNLTAAREQMERFDNGFRTLQREIADAVETRERFKRERELHEFQKKEIDVVAPLPGEDERLQN